MLKVFLNYIWRDSYIHIKIHQSYKLKPNLFRLQLSKRISVRSGIRTHAHISGLRPERSALDHSAILTYMIALYGMRYTMIKAKPIF